MYAYATSTTVTAHKGETIRVYEGEVWDADDEFVKANRPLFSDKPTKLRSSAPKQSVPSPEPAPVEEATAVPGTKRRTRAN